MNDWKTYRLRDIGTIVGGATPSTAVAEYYGGDVPWLTPKDLSSFHDRYIERGERNITQAGLESCSAQMLPAGSVLFSSRAPIGYVAIAKNPVATNQGFKSIVPDTSKADSLFLYYLLRYNKDNIEALGSGTTFKEVSGATMKNVEVSLPPLAEQKRIAGILGVLDDKIELNRRINANLEEQAKALYKSWFVDFEPFKDGGFVDSELGPIPEGWLQMSFSEFCIQSSEKVGDRIVQEYSITNNGIIPREQKYSKKLSQNISNNKAIYRGDLIFGMSRDILNWGVMQDAIGSVSPAYTVYRINGIASFYLENYILSHSLYFKDLIKPAAREGQGIDKQLLCNKLLYYPPQEILAAFDRVYRNLMTDIYKVEIEKLAALRDALLPKLMRGEINV